MLRHEFLKKLRNGVNAPNPLNILNNIKVPERDKYNETHCVFPISHILTNSQRYHGGVAHCVGCNIL